MQNLFGNKIALLVAIVVASLSICSAFSLLPGLDFRNSQASAAGLHRQQALPSVPQQRLQMPSLRAPYNRASQSCITVLPAAGSEPGVNLRNLTVGGGCFWCTEAVFQQLEAVTKVMPGYAGGTTRNPSYKQVCSGKTGHAEVIQVTYDTTKVALSDLLDLFFAAHDPTQVNRQGADVGQHYRSIILYEDEGQKDEAYKAAERAQIEYKDRKIFGIIPAVGKIATQIVPLDTFWPAETYHKDYFLNNQNMPYCAVNIGPKLRSFKVRSKVSAIGPIDGKADAGMSI